MILETLLKEKRELVSTIVDESTIVEDPVALYEELVSKDQEIVQYIINNAYGFRKEISEIIEKILMDDSTIGLGILQDVIDVLFLRQYGVNTEEYLIMLFEEFFNDERSSNKDLFALRSSFFKAFRNGYSNLSIQLLNGFNKRGNLFKILNSDNFAPEIFALLVAGNRNEKITEIINELVELSDNKFIQSMMSAIIPPEFEGKQIDTSQQDWEKPFFEYIKNSIFFQDLRQAGGNGLLRCILSATVAWHNELLEDKKPVLLDFVSRFAKTHSEAAKQLDYHSFQLVFDMLGCNGWDQKKQKIKSKL